MTACGGSPRFQQSNPFQTLESLRRGNLKRSTSRASWEEAAFRSLGFVSKRRSRQCATRGGTLRGTKPLSRAPPMCHSRVSCLLLRKITRRVSPKNRKIGKNRNNRFKFELRAIMHMAIMQSLFLWPANFHFPDNHGNSADERRFRARRRWKIVPIGDSGIAKIAADRRSFRAGRAKTASRREGHKAVVRCWEWME